MVLGVACRTRLLTRCHRDGPKRCDAKPGTGSREVWRKGCEDFGHTSQFEILFGKLHSAWSSHRSGVVVATLGQSLDVGREHYNQTPWLAINLYEAFSDDGTFLFHDVRLGSHP
jgi:hypothetical protein